MAMRVLVKFDQEPSSHSQVMSNSAVLLTKCIFDTEIQVKGQMEVKIIQCKQTRLVIILMMFGQDPSSHGSAMSNYPILQSKCIFDPFI